MHQPVAEQTAAVTIGVLERPAIPEPCSTDAAWGDRRMRPALFRSSTLPFLLSLPVSSFAQTVPANPTKQTNIKVSFTVCTAVVTDQIKPGFKETDLTSSSGDEVHYFSRREITSTSCSIE
jgi:hypothetical protein